VANGLDGNVAIVTGASSGMGEATSEALAAEGATVVAAARREERLADLKGRVEDNGGRLEVVQADVTDEEAQQGVQALHQLDILQAEDIASAVAYCVTRPERVSVNDDLEKRSKKPWRRLQRCPADRQRGAFAL
jgi:NADP-dependent 3-hydroxy acid dehydrogenase YdfG